MRVSEGARKGALACFPAAATEDAALQVLRRLQL